MFYPLQIFILCDEIMQKLFRVPEAAYLAFCLQPPDKKKKIAALLNLPQGTKVQKAIC